MCGVAELKSVELFAGAGGLAIGLKEAGFAPEGVVEFDKHAYLKDFITTCISLGGTALPSCPEISVYVPSNSKSSEKL